MSRLGRHPAALAAGLVLLVAALERVALWLVYPLAHYSDSSVYRWLAERILNGWVDYNGTRLPGYPLFLAAVGSDARVYLAQLALGLVMTALFFYLGWRGSGSLGLGVAAGLGYTLNLGQLFFEASLLTETLTAFWVLLAVVGVFVWLRQPERRSLLLAAFIGAAAGLAGLTRPLFVFLPFWAAAFLALASLAQGRRMVAYAILGAAVPGALILGAWVNFIHSRFAIWNLSTLTGYQLVQHTGYFFEYVPDEYAGLRDVYLRYRDARIAEYGTQGNAIWAAIPEMMQASGLDFISLSRTLARISLQLIWEHPTLYLRTVVRGWMLFWLAPVYWHPEAIASAGLRAGLESLVGLERAALFGANLVFLASSILALASRRLRRLWSVDAFMAFIATTVWLTSLLQTLPDHGDNPRFLVPLQSLVVFWVLWIGYHTWKGRHAAIPAKA